VADLLYEQHRAYRMGQLRRERDVELQMVEGEPADVGERGECGAEVVERQPTPRSLSRVRKSIVCSVSLSSTDSVTSTTRSVGSMPAPVTAREIDSKRSRSEISLADRLTLIQRQRVEEYLLCQSASWHIACSRAHWSLCRADRRGRRRPRSRRRSSPGAPRKCSAAPYCHRCEH